MDRTLITDPYKVLINYEALYESPKNKSGEYIGPLVAYAGVEPTTQKNWVGFAYYNISKVEQSSEVREYLAQTMAKKIKDEVGSPTLIIGAPMGGIILAVSAADQLKCDVAFFEKKVTKLADSAKNTKEKSELVFNRHVISKHDKVILFEDVCNNFSTTDQMINLINAKGATILAIVCIVNRSPFHFWEEIPIVSAIHINTPEYSQTDPNVKNLIAAGNIVWKPKAEWERLKKAME